MPTRLHRSQISGLRDATPPGRRLRWRRGPAAALLLLALAQTGACSSVNGEATPEPGTAVTVARDGVSGAPTPPIPRTAGALQRAAKFAAAWAHPTLTPNRWWQGVAPYCTTDYANRLRTVDPRNVPAHRITGSVQATGVTSGYLLTTHVLTDAGTLVMQLAATNGRWLVSGTSFTRG